MNARDRELIERTDAETLRFAILLAERRNAEVTRIALLITATIVVFGILLAVMA